jgi:hypothetical protein
VRSVDASNHRRRAFSDHSRACALGRSPARVWAWVSLMMATASMAAERSSARSARQYGQDTATITLTDSIRTRGGRRRYPGIMRRDEEEPENRPILAHADFGAPDCCGCLLGIIRVNQANIECNEFLSSPVFWPRQERFS